MTVVWSPALAMAASLGACQLSASPPALHDARRPGIRLTLTRQVLRHDWRREATDSGQATVETSYHEGEYRVEPDTAYGLRRGRQLRVDCAMQQATTVIEAA